LFCGGWQGGEKKEKGGAQKRNYLGKRQKTKRGGRTHFKNAGKGKREPVRGTDSRAKIRNWEGEGPVLGPVKKRKKQKRGRKEPEKMDCH